MNPLFIGLLLYLLVILVVGTLSVRRNRTHEDFLIASRKLGPFAISLSERASAESAWLVVGLPGAAYAIGMGEFWTVIGCLLGIYFSWIWIARPLRELAGKYNALTLPDLLSAHFSEDHRESHPIRLLATGIIIFFYVFYVSAQFVGAGKVLNTTFQTPYLLGMLIGGGIIVLYTLLGGFFAVVWTDVVQALIMFVALVILPIIGAVNLLGGNTSSVQDIPSSFFSLFAGQVGLAALAFMLKGLSWGFGYLGQPHLLIRYMAIRDPQEIPRGRHIALVWATCAFLGAFAIGIVGALMYGLDTFQDSERIMPTMAMTLVPLWLAGILISGGIAAMMSTADSQLLVATSSVSEDVYVKFLGKSLPQHKLLWFNRVSMAIIAIFAFIFAVISESTVYGIVAYAWSGLGSSFGPVIVLMLYWKKITRAGAVAGLLTGSLSTILWSFLPTNAILPERFVSFLFAFAAVLIVSILTQKSRIHLQEQ